MGPSQPQACLQGLGPCLEVTAEHATAAAPEEAKPPPPQQTGLCNTCAA